MLERITCHRRNTHLSRCALMAHARIAALGAAVTALVVIAALPPVRSHQSVQEHTTVARAVVSAPTFSRAHAVAAYRDGILGSSTTCSYRATTIACNDPALGWWNRTDSCYWNLVSPQPPAGSPLWLGNLPADGDLYHRTCETDGGLGIGVLGTSVAFARTPRPVTTAWPAPSTSCSRCRRSSRSASSARPSAPRRPAAVTAWSAYRSGCGRRRRCSPGARSGSPSESARSVSTSSRSAQGRLVHGRRIRRRLQLGTNYAAAAGRTTSPNCG